MMTHTAWSLVLLVGGVLSLAVAVGTVLADWRWRVRRWRTEPARLVERPPAHRRLHRLVVAASVLVGFAGISLAREPLTPVAVLLAAYACLTVGHRECSNGIGRAGLALVGMALACAAVAWLPTSPANATLGAAVAAMLMLWLARFWGQQLNDGRPWTTTGRLIPEARYLTWIAVPIEGGLAAAWLARGVFADWQSIAACVLVLIHWGAIVWDCATRREACQAEPRPAGSDPRSTSEP